MASPTASGMAAGKGAGVSSDAELEAASRLENGLYVQAVVDAVRRSSANRHEATLSSRLAAKEAAGGASTGNPFWGEPALVK